MTVDEIIKTIVSSEKQAVDEVVEKIVDDYGVTLEKLAQE